VNYFVHQVAKEIGALAAVRTASRVARVNSEISENPV
jgi:hypothetical protein